MTNAEAKPAAAGGEVGKWPGWGRAVPIAATLLVGLAHAFVWREHDPRATWFWLGMVYGPVLMGAVYYLHREQALGELFRPVAGDLSRGISGAALGIALVYGVALGAFTLFPRFVGRDLVTPIAVAASASATARALGVVAFSAIEEIVWRGAVTRALEGRFGSKRAPWLASGLFMLSMVPSLHPSLIAASVILGLITAFVRARFPRLTVPIVVHAFFTWVTVEMILPVFLEKMRALG